jgi:hypothetical protein
VPRSYRIETEEFAMRRSGGRKQGNAVKVPFYCVATLLASAAWMTPALASAQVPANGGPYNASFLAGGIGIERQIETRAVTLAGAPYAVSTWLNPDSIQPGDVPLIVLGVRGLSLVNGRLTVRDGAATVRGPVIAAGRWTHVAAVSDGARLTLYVNGRPLARGACERHNCDARNRPSAARARPFWRHSGRRDTVRYRAVGG